MELLIDVLLFLGPNTYEYLVLSTPVLELADAEFLGDNAIDQSSGGGGVSHGLDQNLRRGKDLREDFASGKAGKSPIISPSFGIVWTNLRDPREGGQEYAPGTQRLVQFPN